MAPTRTILSVHFMRLDTRAPYPRLRTGRTRRGHASQGNGPQGYAEFVGQALRFGVIASSELLIAAESDYGYGCRDACWRHCSLPPFCQPSRCPWRAHPTMTLGDRRPVKKHMGRGTSACSPALAQRVTSAFVG